MIRLPAGVGTILVEKGAFKGLSDPRQVGPGG